MQKREKGFTLIEIMIAVVIVGILAAIAVPQYGAFVRDARRTDAHIALHNAAQQLERCRTQSFTYVACALPATSPDGHYGITTNLAVNTFTVTATPVAGGAQAADAQCATLTLNQLGVEGGTGTAANPGDTCW